MSPGSLTSLILLDWWIWNSTGIFQQSSGVVFDYLHLILHMFFPSSAYNYSFRRLSGSRVMVNILLVLFSCVVINVVLHAHILAWVFVPCLFSSPTEVICQYTVFPHIMWWICTCLLAQLWDEGNVILLDVLHQNHQQSRWN